MKIKLELKNVDATAKRIISDDVRLFANETWGKLYEPFIPWQEGNLYDDKEITKDYIHHKVPYASRMYHGEGFEFDTGRNALATAYWDKVAWNSQGQKLINSVENYIKRKG